MTASTVFIYRAVLALSLACGAAACSEASHTQRGPEPSGAEAVPEGYQSIEPYTVDYSPRVIKATLGFGMVVENDNYPLINAIAGNSPASRAGLQVGDVLIAVNGRDFLKHPVCFPCAKPCDRFVLRLRRGTEEFDADVVAVPTRQAR